MVFYIIRDIGHYTYIYEVKKAHVIIMIKVHYTAQNGHQHLPERDILTQISCHPI